MNQGYSGNVCKQLVKLLRSKAEIDGSEGSKDFISMGNRLAPPSRTNDFGRARAA